MNKQHLGPARRRKDQWALAAAAAIAAAAAAASPAQAQSLLPAFVDGGMRLGIRDVKTLPNTQSTSRPLPTGDRQGTYQTRLNFFKQAPDGRRFVNDERGLLYNLNPAGTNPNVFLDFKTFEADGASNLWNRMQFGTGNAAGFVTFEFHPEFSQVGKAGYGKFYTVHTEVADKAHAAGFTTPYIPKAAPDTQAYDLNDLNHHTVLSEWTMSNAAAGSATRSNTTRREMIRAGHPASSYFHPFGDTQFRPTAQPGDADYGLLYIAGGDWGFINGGGAGGADGSNNLPVPGALQRLDTLAGTFIRIDPNADASRPGRTGPSIPGAGYSVPTDNPYAGDGNANTLGEIYAHGFRNGHRLAFDGTDILVANVGQAKVEEVELVRPGRNYGWAAREGTFINGLDVDDGGNGTNPDYVVRRATAADDANEGPYTYPVIEYDHDSSRGDQAIAGGFVYRGRAMPELRGKYVFGDMNLGRMYVAEWAEIKALFEAREAGTVPNTSTVLAKEFKLLNNKILADLVQANAGTTRTDLRFGMGTDGELYLLTGTDGRVRQLYTPSVNLTSASPNGVLFQGLQTRGGVNARLGNVTRSGDLSGEYISDLDVAGLVSEGFLTADEADDINFAVAGSPAQFWDLDFAGATTGANNFTFTYDAALLGSTPESALAIWQYDAMTDEWDRLSGVIDVTYNQITFSTETFSPMLLGVVPEPSALGLVGAAGAMLLRRRHRR